MFPYKESLVQRTQVEDDYHCNLEFDPDPQRWPWLSLPCWHPVVVEKYAYFSGVTAGLAVGMLSESTFTALTGMQWSFHGPPDRGRYPHSASCQSMLRENAAAYSLCALDAAGDPVFRIEGKGVIFRNRDFGSWRSQGRSAKGPGEDNDPFVAATAREAATNVKTVCISPLSRDASRCLGQFTREGGFYPAHPYHTGSGDHVNAAQLLDSAFQAAHAILLSKGLRNRESGALFCHAGRASFRSYIELDETFEIELTALQQRDEGQFELRFNLSQRETLCTRITLQLAAD